MNPPPADDPSQAASSEPDPTSSASPQPEIAESLDDDVAIPPPHEASAPLAPGQLAELVVDDEFAGARLDIYLAKQFPHYSRVHLRKAIDAAGVQVGGARAKASHRLRVGDTVRFVLPELPREAPVAEDLPLDILYEDDDLAVLNKAPNMVIHPAKGHWSGTLTSALQFHFDRLSSVGGSTRPGIVHRLDRDTSGVLVVAKNDAAHLALSGQFEARTVKKEYLAVVIGRLDRDQDQIDQPIGIHPYQREKMAIRHDHSTSRPAQTFYEVLERFAGFTVVRVLPKTGRTHQIRVHLNHVGCPILCDRLYGGRAEITRGELRGRAPDGDVVLSRQALHAARLQFTHPRDGRPMDFVAPLTADLAGLLEELRVSRPLSAGGR